METPANANAGDVPLTTVTTLVSRGGQETHVAAAFARAFGERLDATHHRTVLLVQQENGISLLISQFRSEQELMRWRASAERAWLIEELDGHALRELCSLDRPVARIVVPSDASGPKWKVLLVTWAVSFPLLLAVVQLVEFFASDASLIVRVASTSILMSTAVTWVISPLALRWTRTWRLRDQQMRTGVVEGAGA